MAILLLVGVIIGFRFGTGFFSVIGAFLLLLAFALMFAWVSVLVGLSVNEPEKVQVFGFTAIFPLTFASSIFVPTPSMPDGLRQFAEANPFTTIADAVRSLWLNTPAHTDVWMAFIWCFVLIAIFAPLAVARYRRVVAK